MLGSIEIGRVLGIRVRLHWLFIALVLFLVFLSGDQWAGLFGGLVMLFGVVFLHEMGHCLVARHFGIRVLDITFWPLGGMARMSEIPESSRVEGWIAIAGPAVNFALALMAAPLVLLLFFLSEPGSAGGLAEVALDLAGTFVLINLGLGLFNLVPAFPMDGGRVLRAWLGRNGDWLGATESAVRVGRVFAVIGFAVGLLMGNPILALIGAFVWFAGSRELAAVRIRHRRREGLGAGPFGPFGFGGPPTGSAPPPGEWSSGGATGEGFGAEEIERLERFRGPLRRFRPPE